MKLNNRPMNRRIGAAAVSAAVISCGGLAWTPAALATPTVASVTTLNTGQSSTHSAALTPETAVPRNATACQEWLQIHGYRVSIARASACHVAALGRPNPHVAILACTVALVATRVNAAVAGTACTFGAVPG
jgi:hypothetical protein